MTKPLKVLFAGTADFSATFLQPIIDSHHQVVAVVTQMDKVSGRGKKVQMTKVKEIALAHDIPVYQFATSLRNPENYQELLKLDFDIMVVVAFGDILPIELLDHPKYKSINVHPSLLPFGRGASPVQNTIAKGDDKTAFCIIKMDATLDTGDILVWEDVAVDRYETSESLFAKLSEVGAPILIKVLDNIETYLENAQPQAPLDIENPKKAYTRKIKKEHGRFKPDLEAITLERKMRAYSQWPSLFYAHPQQADQDVKVIAAEAFANLTELLHHRANLKFIPQLEALNDRGNLQDNLEATLANPELGVALEQIPTGTIIAETKKTIYVLCGKGSVLEISSIQIPGKKAMDIASVRNGYPQLVTLGQLLLAKEEPAVAI